MKDIIAKNNSDNLASPISGSVLGDLEDSVFSTIFNNNLAVMMIVDPDNKQQILEVNEAAVRFYGYTREQFLHMSIGDINTLPPIERQKLMKKTIKNSHSSFQFIHKTSSGSLKDVMVTASPLALKHKKAMFIIVHDITVQKIVESRLRESKNKYRGYFDNSPLSLWEQDYSEAISYLHGLPLSGVDSLRDFLDTYPEVVKKCSKMLKILDVNPATLSLYKTRSKEELFRNLEHIYTPQSAEMFKTKLISLYHNETTISDETIHRTLNGKKLHVKVETTLLPNLRALVTITDITELKEKESELKKLLEQTRADAETKEILLKEINHRVKNNLSSLIGILYTEKRKSKRCLEEKQLALLNNLINRVKGIGIAHELLSRSSWKPVSIELLSEKIIHSLGHLVPSDRSVETKITSSSIFLDADQSHSMAVIINELFVNTVEHAVHSGEKIKVTIKIKEKNDYITYIYQDTGSGFSEDVLANKSSNVGLYLIKNIVEQSLRGSVNLDNKGGAIITMQFPGGIDFEEIS